jgi:hypothetical protein
VFWDDAYGLNNPVVGTTGAYAQITDSDRAFTCSEAPGVFASGQTVRVLLGGTQGHYVEVGWGQQWCTSTSRCQRSFFEHEVGWAVEYLAKWPISCLNPGTRSAWRIYWNASGWWQGDIQCYSSGAWAQVDTRNDATHSGWADNEGFNRAGANGAENGMNETHSVLQYRDANNVWQTTPNVCARYDTSGLWNGNWLGSTSFNFTTGGGQGC